MDRHLITVVVSVCHSAGFVHVNVIVLIVL